MANDKDSAQFISSMIKDEAKDVAEVELFYGPNGTEEFRSAIYGPVTNKK